MFIFSCMYLKCHETDFHFAEVSVCTSGFYCTPGDETCCELALLTKPAHCAVKPAKLFRAIIHWVEIRGFKVPSESVIYLQMMGCLPSCLGPRASASRGREQNRKSDWVWVMMQWWRKKERRREWGDRRKCVTDGGRERGFWILFQVTEATDLQIHNWDVNRDGETLGRRMGFTDLTYYCWIMEVGQRLRKTPLPPSLP